MHNEHASFSPQRLKRAARILLYAAGGLLPVFIVPVPVLDSLLAKVVLFTTLLGGAVLLHIAAETRAGEVRLPRALFLGAAAFLPAVYVAAALFSENPLVSWFGNAGTDTVFFMVLCFATLAAIPLLMTEEKDVRTLLSVFFGTAALVGVFQLFNFLSSALSLDFFAPTENLIGSWNNLGAYMGIVLIASATALQFGRFRGLEKGILWFLLAISLLTTFLVNLTVLWATLFLSLVGLFIIGCFPRFDLRRGFARHLPLFTAVIAALSGLLLLYGDAWSSKAASSLGIGAIEARPSLESTFSVAEETYKSRALAPLLGSGPNTFNEQWAMHKPDEVNASVFWGVDFQSGFGTIPTSFVTAGLFGGIAWLILIAGALFTMVRLFLRLREREEDMLALGLAASFGALGTFALAAVFPLNQTVLLTAFMLAGAGLAISRTAGSPALVYSFERGPRDRAIAGSIVAVCALLSLIGIFAIGRHAASEAYNGLAVRKAQAGALEEGYERAQTALSIKRSDKNLRLLTDIGLLRLRAIASEPQDEGSPARFEEALRPTLDYALEAVRYDPRAYLNWFSLARVYDFLATLEVQGAYDNAKASYSEAIAKNPKHPGLYVHSARLEASQGNYSAARDLIARALEKKPNFTEAVLLTVQMEYLRGNMQGAITAARAAAATAPQNATLWFELGLLLYTNNATTEAIGAFRNALTAAPTFANAKYFLGLSLDRVGLKADAITLFEGLRREYPDNQELDRILTNLRSGKSALAAAPEASPLQRQTAPIAQ